MKERSDFSNKDTTRRQRERTMSVLFAKGEDHSIYECVCLRIHCAYLAVKFFHGDEVQRLKGVSCWGNEIKADVDPGVVVVKQRTFDLQLFLEIVFKLSVNVVNDWLVTVERVKKKSVKIYVCG